MEMSILSWKKQEVVLEVEAASPTTGHPDTAHCLLGKWAQSSQCSLARPCHAEGRQAEHRIRVPKCFWKSVEGNMGLGTGRTGLSIFVKNS